jgi:Tol biopolymer transport system component
MAKARHLEIWLLVSSAVLAAGIMLLVSAGQPAEAAFPGVNGRIVYDDYAGRRHYDIESVRPEGTGITSLTRNRVPDIQPSWSPDGSKIVFHTVTYNPEIQDGDFDLYTINADGTGRTRLTTDPAYDSGAVWSPDGSKIVFTSRRDGRDGVYTMAPEPESETNRPQRLAGGGEYSFDWSPDGEKIAFEVNVAPNSHDGRFEIYTMNADGTNRTRLTYRDRWSAQSPAWSPNGEKIAFERLGHIYIINPAREGATNKPRQIVESGGAFGIDWQPIPR